MRKIIALFWIGVLMAFSTTLSAAVTYCTSSAVGYGASATGGGSATPVLVSSVSQLQSALNKGKNKVIIITADLTFTSMLSVQDGSNVTLMALPGVKLISLQQDKSSSGILYIKRFSNLIIRNLTFVGPGAYDCDGNDLLCLQDVTNAWVDHCDFQDGCDGNFDNKNGTDNVTVSWCRFRYLKAPKSGGETDDHRFTNLLGSSSSDKPSDGTYNMTWAYCWWDDGCKERMLRCRNASLHFLNCYWNSSVANYYIGPENADCYIEGCTFEGAPKTAKIFYQNYGGKNGSKFINCTATKGLPGNVSDRTVVTPSYSYTALTAAEAKTAVTNATCGAGATLTVTTAGVVSSTCDGGAPLPTVWTVTWDATTNGGSCGTATSSVTNGAAIGTLPEATKTSFNFDGWYTAPSGGTKISASTTVTENKTYYAQFTSAPVTTYYTVIWDANGGTCGTSSSSIESGQQIGTLPVASKVGDYSFDGWYTAVNGGTKISTTTTVTANVTYYAHYTATGGGGGSGSCTSTLTHYGKQYRTSDPRRGYAYVGSTSGTKFIIESNSSDIKNTSADSAAIRLPYSNKYLKVLGPGATTDITDSLFSGVTAISFKWVYVGSTTNYTTDIDVYVGSTKVATKSLTGNKNDDYATATISSIASLNGTVKLVNTGTSSSNQKFNIDDISITYSCSGGSSTYTLTYDENGGSGTMTAATGTSATVAANGFTAPTGYSFQEWNTEMNGGGTTKAVGATITLTEDMTLYAIWQPNTYTVTLNAEGGTGGSTSATATFDAALPNITIPTRDGYVFKGYYTGTDGTGTQYYDTNGSSTNDWTIAANTELHAYWETGSTPIVSGCDLHFWFVKEADATTNSKTNDGTFFSGMVTNSSSLSGSITIDGTSYSVTGRSGDAASFGSFTIPTGHAGTFYALAVSSGGGDRQINLNNGSDVYELPVAGGSSSYKRIESEELPAGTYTIERDGTSNVRLGIVVVKVCSTEPCTPPAAPTAFATTDVASTTATFSITDPANTNNYEIYYSTNSTAPAVDATPTTTTATTTKAVSGLTSGTTYYAWVRAVCDADNKSAWVALSGSSFTTGRTQPTLYTVAASAEGECAGGMTVKVTLSGSQTGIDYQLKNNGANDGAVKAGTGSALEWKGKSSGVYTIWAVENATYSGRQMSKTVTVEIYDATAITTQPTTSVSAETSESFTLGSGMVAAGHELTYRWYTCSSTGTDTVFISGATAATYTASQAVANTYYYRVRVAGTCGDPVLSDVITVTVSAPASASAAPTISGQPAGATYCAEDAITDLSITASGSGTVTYQWKKDGVNIPSATGATYAPSAAGTYVCVVTNTEDGKSPTSLNSNEAVITINAAVVAPTMSQTENTVSLATVTDGATIYYTTDGTDPTTSSASGTSVTIVADCTVKAYAVKDGCESSIESFAATYVVVCPKWVGTPSSWTDSKITVGLLELETSDASKTAISSNAVWSGHNETVTAISGSNVYIQGHLTDGAELGTITISAANNQSSGDYEYVIIFCANSSFTSGVTGQTWAAPSYTDAQDDAKLVHSFTAPVGAKYFRIYRKVDAIGGYAGGGDGKTTRIYRIESCPAETFEVTYKANGGTGADVVEDTRVVGDVPGSFTAPSGKVFDHWDTAPDDGGVDYDPDDAVTSDLTLYAQWVNYYTVTFDLQGHGSTIAPYSPVLYNATIDAPEDPVAAGWIFGGWYKEPGCSNKWNFASDHVTANTTLYAKWTQEPAYQCYIIGSCKIKDDTWKQGENGSFGIYKYIPNGEASNIELSTDFTVEPASPSTGSFYYKSKDLAHLKDKDYWETGSSSSRTIKAMDMKDATLQLHLGTLQAAKIELYGTTNTNTAGQIQLVASGKQTKTIETGSANNGKLYYTDLVQDAPYTGDEVSVVVGSQTERFVVIVYVPAVKIIYNANGGTGTMADQVTSIGETVQLRENTFTRSGYKFMGWTTDPAGTGELIGDGAMYIMEDEDVTLYAKWSEIIHTTITLDATGAYNSYTHIVTATNGEAMPEIATLPLRVGYVFDGYYDAPNGAGTKYYTGMGDGVRTWDKTSVTATLYAKWLAPCDLVPTLQNIVPVVTIWDGKDVDMGVVRLTCDYDTTGIQYDLLSVSPTTPINGCHFEYFDEQIHLMGTPSVGNTITQNVSVTFTMKNNCNPASTYTVTQQIRIYPASQKAKVAFIITGTENGTFDAYDSDDASSCNSLVTYLSSYYDITYVNGYATKNEADLATYYSDYDLLVVTDFLNTGKGYTNAIGTLIDKKPILSFEAYVANQSNWHIGSNPKDPKPKVQDMKVLCAGHAIFGNAKYDPGDAAETVVVRADTTVNVLSSLSGEKDAKGLQGFTINEAPDFIFLATVRDANNTRDLIVCCERQVVFPARLLLYGINFYEMPNLSKPGKIIMKQMIDYLLMTDETKVADCSLVFDNNDGDHLWSNPKNWAPGYNIVPTPYHPTRIIAECWVNVDNAHAGSVKVNKGRDENGNPVDGKVIVKPYGGLTVAGMVMKVNDTRYASPITIKAEDLLIEANALGNGAFVYGNKESDVRATVQYYSLAEKSNTTNPVWQYIGIPFQAGQTAIGLYYEAWMCRWSSASDGSMGGLWQWVNNEDVLVPFEGYCITQESKKTYTFAGKLNAPVTTAISLDNRDDDGYAFAANSWTAPIKIQEMADEDFVNAERAIYIYHTGSYAQWGTNGDPVNAASGSAATLPGQYAVVPIHSSPYLSGADSVIPSMQGFFVKTTPGEDAELKLVYNRTVYDATYFKTSTQPMRAPRRVKTEGPIVMRLMVSGAASGGDQVHLLARSDFSEQFEDGWDGRKLEGDAAAPKLAVVKEAGEMAVAAIPTAEERFLSFRAGEDTEYTFSFAYEGETLYLYDVLTQEATLIRTGNTYTFTADNKTAINRFMITAHPPKLPTDVENTEYNAQNAEVKKLIIEDNVYILRGNGVYDVTGRRVAPFAGKEEAQ